MIENLLRDRVASHVLSDVHGENHSSFLQAAATGDLNKLARCLRAGMNPMLPGPGGNTVLHLAAIDKQEVIAYLNQYLGGSNFADLSEVKNSQGLTAYAIARNAFRAGVMPQRGTPPTMVMLGSITMATGHFHWQSPQGYTIDYHARGNLLGPGTERGESFTRITGDNAPDCPNPRHRRLRQSEIRDGFLKPDATFSSVNSRLASNPIPGPVANGGNRPQAAPLSKTWFESLTAWMPRWPF